jgi:sulfite reductase (ferredoxin)
MTQATTWKEKLQEQIAVETAQQIDVFESQLKLRKQGRIDEKVFAETRLRRGVYGQRYDNGQRHDGFHVQNLTFPTGRLTKGPDTAWDAPGMQRIKVPYGGLTPDQLDVLGQLADEYSNGILHVTTRQDFQLHYVHIEDTPDLMRRLAAVGLTTLEACGNSIRNITACHLAGVCRTESFDVSPHAAALTAFLLGHGDAQDFGRKFKTAFSGCEDEGCGLVKMHDLGFLARLMTVDGRTQRGFAIYVGGGLGTVPHQAQLLSDFAPETEILPLTQAVARVFARLGEKRNRNRARLKFLVARLGIEEFRRLVFEERQQLPYDERWTALLARLPEPGESPAAPLPVIGQATGDGLDRWLRSNVYRQRQPAFYVVTVVLPLGDLSAAQAFQLSDVARRFVGDNLRTTVEQNIVLRWVREGDLPALYQSLQPIGLAEPSADTVVDITSCPGTDTCKLGIASSRGLAGELRRRLAAAGAGRLDALNKLKIKISGCFNSCGQHHVADIGFFGNSRRRDKRAVPHFQVVLGGKWQENAGSYGLAVGAVPAKAAPDVLAAITERYLAERLTDDSFQQWVARTGKREIRALLEPFTAVPAYDEDPSYYSDWGDPREFTIGDLGAGECAGEVVSLFSLEIAQAEGVHFDALVALDEGHDLQADEKAYVAMVLAARALVRRQFLDVSDDPDDIVAEFRRRFYDSRLFFDKYAGGKFAHYLFSRHASPPKLADADSASRLVQEAQLFIEAVHACDARLA